MDANDRRELGSLLEDEAQTNGLVTDWVVVRRACNRFDKRRRWLDDSDMAGPVVQRRKAPIETEMTKQSEPTERAMENSAIEELARKFKAVSVANMSHRGPKGKDPYRCVWCDSIDHARKDCASLQAAIQQNLIYMEDNIIH